MKRLQGIVIGVLITVIISGVIGYASPKTIEVIFNNMKIKVNGNDIKSDTEPFVYENRTYVPLRAVAENLGADVYWDGATNMVSIQDSRNEKISDYYDSIYLLGTSTRLTEISDSLFGCLNILAYESRDSYVFDNYYEIYKLNRDSFEGKKDEYLTMALSIINNSTCSENIEIANKLLVTVELLKENIDLLADLYVAYDDYNKVKKFSDNRYDITMNNADTRNIIYDFINK